MDIGELAAFINAKIEAIAGRLPDAQDSGLIQGIYQAEVAQSVWECREDAFGIIERNLEIQTYDVVPLGEVHEVLRRRYGFSHVGEDYRDVIARLLVEGAIRTESDSITVESLISELKNKELDEQALLRLGIDGFDLQGLSRLQGMKAAYDLERRNNALREAYPPPYPDEQQEFRAFLTRKAALILDRLQDAELEAAHRARWNAEVSELDGGLLSHPVLERLDRVLEGILKDLDPTDRSRLRRKLRHEFGYARLSRSVFRRTPPMDSAEFSLIAPSLGRGIHMERPIPSSFSFESANLGELCQIFADCTGWTVSVPRRLLAHPMQGVKGFRVPRDSSDFVHSMEAALARNGMYVTRSRRGSILIQERGSSKKVSKSLPQEDDVARGAAAALSTEQFWDIIERARENAADTSDVAQRAREIVSRLRKKKRLGFRLRLEERLVESYRHDLWAVAYIVNGGCSDDAFEYFRGWLIAQGRRYFERALQDPQTAADRAEVGLGKNQCEEMLYVGMEPLLPGSREVPPPLVLEPNEPLGETWLEADLPRMFPQLVEKFSRLWEEWGA